MRKKLIPWIMLILSVLALSSYNKNTGDDILIDYTKSFLTINSFNNTAISINDEYTNKLGTIATMNDFPLNCYDYNYLTDERIKTYSKDLGENVDLDGSLLVYTFNIKNNTEPKDINISLAYSMVIDYFDEISRVLLYVNNEYSIYQKKDDLEKLGIASIDYPNQIVESTIYDGDFIFNKTIRIEQELKISIFIWIDINDPDMSYDTEALYTTAGKLELNIN